MRFINPKNLPAKIFLFFSLFFLQCESHINDDLTTFQVIFLLFCGSCELNTVEEFVICAKHCVVASKTTNKLSLNTSFADKSKTLCSNEIESLAWCVKYEVI